MSRRDKHRRKLITDKQTDYLFDYFVYEDKFNQDLRQELDEQMEKKLENYKQPNFGNHISDFRSEKRKSEKKQSQKSDSSPSTSEQEELPPNKSNQKKDVDFTDDETDDNFNSSEQSSVHGSYMKRIDAKPNNDLVNHIPKPTYPCDFYEENFSNNKFNHKPLLGEKLINDPPKYVETPEERRARARDAYSKLQDLIEKYQIQLTKNYTIDDNPDEMEAEYKMHKERRNKYNQVKFYKQILLNIICGAEFLNTKYDPFSFKLQDWSKQIATDLDDYTEVLEELYEKYKDKGGKMAPEIRLLFMIIMSGVTFHLSQALFGSGGLNDTLNKNPNILNKLLNGLIKNGGADHEPSEAKQPPPDNKNILESIRKYNKNKSDTKTETQTTDRSTETTSKLYSSDELINIEKEKRIMAEQKLQLETLMHKQEEMYRTQMEQLKNHQTNMMQQMLNQNQQNNLVPVISNVEENVPINQILSNNTKKPRFQDTLNNIANNEIEKSNNIQNQYSTQTKKSDYQQLSDELDIFDSDIDVIGNLSDPNRKNFDDIIESLESSSVNYSDIKTPSRRKNNKNSQTRSITNRNKTNSTVRKNRTNSASDTLSTVTRTRNNILKL